MKAPDQGPSWRRRRDLFHREAVLELAKHLAEDEPATGSDNPCPEVSGAEDGPEDTSSGEAAADTKGP